jgi:hypothetical protein
MLLFLSAADVAASVACAKWHKVWALLHIYLRNQYRFIGRRASGMRKVVQCMDRTHITDGLIWLYKQKCYLGRCAKRKAVKRIGRTVPLPHRRGCKAVETRQAAQLMGHCPNAKRGKTHVPCFAGHWLTLLWELQSEWALLHFTSLSG